MVRRSEGQGHGTFASLPVELISLLIYNTMNEDIRKARAAIIAKLNDHFREYGVYGRMVLTRGVLAEGSNFVTKALQRVREYNDFTAENDPYGEHDFGSFAVAGKTVNWKIDYLDAAMEWASDDPANPDKTTRVLTIYLTDEY
jgi:Protein of unknown function (DUF3768)